jgi:glycosyltransferase involved in cell wall biosynthesis
MMAFLLEFEELLPRGSASSLRTMAGLRHISVPNIQILKDILGVGRAFAEQRNLHSFFNAMLEFESQQVFLDFVSHGYCLVITGGPRDKIGLQRRILCNRM